MKHHMKDRKSTFVSTTNSKIRKNSISEKSQPSSLISKSQKCSVPSSTKTIENKKEELELNDIKSPKILVGSTRKKIKKMKSPKINQEKVIVSEEIKEHKSRE